MECALCKKQLTGWNVICDDCVEKCVFDVPETHTVCEDCDSDEGYGLDEEGWAHCVACDHAVFVDVPVTHKEGDVE